MTYVFPKTLAPLREHLKGLGLDTTSLKTARQAAFMAQQLVGTRIKFPAMGRDMMPTMLEIQKALEDGRTSKSNHSQQPAIKGIGGGRTTRVKKQKDYSRFKPELFAEGVHIFCDGAAVPNPGAGGWGVVVYEDGIEVSCAFGGDPETTNNQMELTALLNAIEEAWKLIAEHRAITIWSDSAYCVEGVNVWMKTWKARGWNKRKLDSPKRDDGGIKNLELWQAIDASLLEAPKFGEISIKWVKGHAGIAGNERADELAEQGRAISEDRSLIENELDDRYRQIMGAI